MRSFMENLTSLSRKKSWTDKGVLNTKKSKLNAIKTRLMFEIATFLERDDNSRMLPGKNDAVKSSKDKCQKTQKRVLNDYMYNLHLKFLAESTISISRASFYRCRPKHVSLVNFASRNVCLCVKHQNFSFLLRSLKSLGVTTCTSPDKFVEMYQGTHDSFQTMLDKIPTENDMIKFQQWKRVTLKNGKQRQRVVDVDKSRTDFISMMFDEFKAFVSHVTRVKEQYVAIKQMKDKLPDDHVLVQMDFSENYTCTTLEEIQSAYWNSCMVTLHPVVIYYRSNKSDLEHSSYVYVSEVLSHNATMVISIIEKLMKVVKGIVPNVKCIHFWTDSPSSQYRNKTIFDLISKFKQRFDVNASWHYFECGHGKGPCDGVGGTTKRNADNAVKQGKALIQDAGDFFAWASTNESYINYELVTEEEYEHNKELVEKRNSVIKPLKGSMLFHAVIESGVGEVLTRNTSCACDNCFRDGKFDRQSQCGWDTRLIEEKTDLGNDSKNPTMENQLDTDKTSNDHIRDNHGTRNKSIREQVEEKRAIGKKLKEQNKEKIDNGDKRKKQLFSIGRFVVASYDERIYVGKITDIDPNDKTININFMQKCDKYEGRFKWPIRKDELWIDTKNIIKEIEDHKPTGKSGRIFTIDEDALKMLQ